MPKAQHLFAVTRWLLNAGMLFSLLPAEFAENARIQFCGPTGSDAIEAAIKLFKAAVARDGEPANSANGVIRAASAQSSDKTPVFFEYKVQNGDTISGVAARFGIVTVSTEMLNSGKIKFESERPIRQLEAASRLKLGSCDRIALELPGNPLGLQRDDFMFEKADGNRTAALMANVGGSSLVTIDVAGKFGRK